MSTNKNLSAMLPQARFMAGQARANTLARRRAANLFERGHCSLIVWLYQMFSGAKQMCCNYDSQYVPRPGIRQMPCRHLSELVCYSVGKKLKLSWEKFVNDRESTEMLSTGMPEVFENESSFVCRKIVIGDVRGNAL
ncbi:MAG: hypothetical protein JNM51_13070 [Bacteroidia bacterium]|nr:hypothetical protein [Bacteroidia bacterium]